MIQLINVNDCNIFERVISPITTPLFLNISNISDPIKFNKVIIFKYPHTTNPMTNEFINELYNSKHNNLFFDQFDYKLVFNNSVIFEFSELYFNFDIYIKTEYPINVIMYEEQIKV